MSGARLPGRLPASARDAFDLRTSWRRLLVSLPAIAQLTVAAMAAYAISHWGLGHRTPLLSITVAVAALGFKRDARPLRVLRTAIGMTIGILLAELAVRLFGVGFWQLALITVVTLAVARFFSGEPGFAATVLVQSMLVVLIPSPVGGPFVRTIDGVVGGAVAILATILIPRDPRREARRDGERSLTAFVETATGLQSALRAADAALAAAALEKARASQPELDAWGAAIASAVQVSRISPFVRRYRAELLGQQTMHRSMDLAWRNLRVVVRRADYLVGDGHPRPEAADLLGQLATGAGLLLEGLRDVAQLPVARAVFVAVIRRIGTDAIAATDSARDRALMLSLHPLVIDLLCATGMPIAEARTLLPEV